jgi:dihydroorotate dehydrogenase (NAD+) catalytic subunit
MKAMLYNNWEDIDFFGKKISGRFTIPSGVVGTDILILLKFADIPEIGIWTTKSIGIEPRQGNREPIIVQYGYMSFVNAVGLTNPGAEEFANRLSKVKIPDNKFLLVSIFGGNENEFKKVAKILYKYADGFEINISCPHSNKYGQAVGQDLNLVEKIVKSVVSLGKPVFVKISPNLDVVLTVKCCVDAGASGITAINTKGPVNFLHDGYPVLTNKVGGVSGKAILELGLNCVKKVREITDLPIIACGGILTASDVKEYIKAGADFFGIGSASAGMNTKEIKDYFQKLLIDIKRGTNWAESLLKTELNMEYEKYKVSEKKELAEDLFILKMNNNIKVKPGQFVFAWLPDKGEKPFSVLDDKPLTLLVKKRGYFTTELSKLKKNDIIYIRGPYGNSIKTKGKTLLVGGGTGIAALSLFVKGNKKIVMLLGAKDKNYLSCIGEFKSVCKKIYLTTESGEIGHKGLATDVLGKIMEKEKIEYCLNCGPEEMVRAAIEKESKFISRDNIYSSIEYEVRCGIGLCGSCVIPKGEREGERLCVDGTFINY